MWAGQLDALSRSWRVIAPDLRGFGRSDVTSGTVTTEQFADDLAALLDVLAIRESIVFAGLSMGGYIAWQFWQRHVARLGALILCDTRAAADTPETARGRLVSAEQVLSQGLQGLADTMLGKMFAEETVRTQPDIVAATRRVMLGTSPEGVAAALRGMAARPDMTSVLSRINVPTLLMCGEHDIISPSSEMRGIAAAIPNARFIEIPHAGHLSPLEQPQFVNSAIQKEVRG
jgi:pimeloyl-ACP methyl ester carboxylesterase